MNLKHVWNKQRRGMTLLEVIVALGLAAVLTMVVVKLTERQLSANKDFVLRNEIEMIRLEVISLLQGDCRPILSEKVKIAPADNKPDIKDFVQGGTFYTQLPLKRIGAGKATIPYAERDLSSDYYDVKRYANYTKGEVLSDTARSLWLQDVKFQFDPDPKINSDLSSSSNQLKGALFLDFYRRLSTNHEDPKKGESNLTVMIPVKVNFKKAKPGDKDDKGLLLNGWNYVIDSCTCTGEFSLGQEDLKLIRNDICKNFLGGEINENHEGYPGEMCENWNVGVKSNFSDMSASNVQIDQVEATDVLCSEANVTVSGECSDLHTLFNKIDDVPDLAKVTKKNIVKKIYKDESANFNTIITCLQVKSGDKCASPVRLNDGSTYDDPVKLKEGLLEKYKSN